MSLKKAYNDNYMKRVGLAGGKLIGAGVGHSLNAIRAFATVLKEPVQSVGRVFTAKTVEAAKIDRIQGATINKMPYQVDGHTLSQMTTKEAVTQGFIQGFNSVASNKAKPKASPKPAPSARVATSKLNLGMT